MRAQSVRVDVFFHKIIHHDEDLVVQILKREAFTFVIVS